MSTHTPHPDLPPPITNVGVIGWLRSNLFSSWPNTVLTFAAIYLLYLTLPSLIVATCGGGTGLPTQQEGLKIMGCAGVGKVMKFAEIVAGTVLAGEISLAAAISSLDWVSSHEQLGRNDPTRQ